MGNPRGRPKKKKIGYRGADGRAAPKKPKPAQQHELPPGAGDALSHDRGADLMDVVDVNEEEGKTAAGEDVNDEDWCDEDPSGAHSRGRGQSILSFAQQSMVSAARAAGNAAKQIPPRVLSNSQKYRNRKKLFEKQAMGMARTMETWMWRARQQQQQQQQQDEEKSSSIGGEVDPVEEAAVDVEEAAVDLAVAPHTSSPGGRADEDAEASSSCGSVGDMSIGSGYGLSIEEWYSRREMKDAEEVLENNCDTSSDGFLDGLDFSRSTSTSSTSTSTSTSSGGGGGGGERGATSAPLGKEAVDVRQGGGSNGEVGESMRTTEVPSAAGLAAPAPSRRSTREGCFVGVLAPSKRKYNTGKNKAGPGKHTKVMLDEEVRDRCGLAAVRFKGSKGRRAMRKDRVAQEGKTWTLAALDQARGRARKHWKRRKAALMQTYRDAYDKL